MTIRRFNIEPLLPFLAGEHTVLMPNNRSVDAILREHANSKQLNSQRAWVRPSVFAVDIYLQQLWQSAAAQGISPFFEISLLDRFNEQLLWVEVLRSSCDKFPLLNIEEAANSVTRSYQFFKQWGVANEKETKNYNNAIDFHTFQYWSQQFELLCMTRKVASLSDASSMIIANIDALQELIPRHLVLVNFKQPPPLYAKLFKSFGTVTNIEHKFENEDNHSQDLNLLLRDTHTIRRQYENRKMEVSACIEWCKQYSASNTQAHIGIIIDQSRSLEPVIDDMLLKERLRLGSHKIEHSDFLNKYRSRETLADSPIMNLAITILELNSELVDSNNFCRVLQASTTVAADTELQQRIALELYLRKNIETKIRLSELRKIMLRSDKNFYCPILAEALLHFSQAAPREKSVQSMREWMHLFSIQLQLLGWSDTKPALWKKCEQRLAASSSSIGSITLAVALKKLSSFLKQANSNLQFNDRLQVSLVDIEEAQDFEFDSCWLLAMDDRSWPPAISPVAFIPYGLQRKLAMPASSSEIQLKTVLSQLLQLRKNTRHEIVISHHRQEEELEIRPSALLKEMEIDNHQESTEVTAQYEFSRSVESIKEELYIPLQSNEKIKGGTSLLSNQSNCPFKAFSRNRLKVDALDEFNLGLNPMARGNALHLALEKLATELDDSERLQQLSDSEIQQQINDCVVAAIDYLQKRYPESMTPAFSQLEKNRLKLLIQEFLKLEKERSPFLTLSREESLKWDYSRLSLNLRIDRIDQLEDGSLALIDYKTGKKSNYKWFDERPDDMQLPLYQIAVAAKGDKHVSATLIYQLNAQNIALFGTTDLDTIHPDTKTLASLKTYSGTWLELQERWNSIIHGLVSEFESGLVAIAPTRGKLSCQYCNLKPLCRISEFEQQQLTAAEEKL